MVEINQLALTFEEEKKQKELQEAILRCPSGHKIVFYQNGFKRRVGSNGNV